MPIPFLLYIFVMLYEYLGIDRGYFPALKGLPIALGIQALLLLYVVIKYKTAEVLKTKQSIYFLFLIFFTGLALFHGLIRSYALDPLKQEIGYYIFFFIGCYLLRNKKLFETFIFSYVIIHIYLVVANLAKFSIATRVGGFKAGYFMGDGNDFSWGLVIALPLAIYLLTQKKILIKMAGVLGTIFSLLGLVGAQSRGATLALGASLLYYVLASKKKIQGLFVLALVGCLVLFLAPPSYFTRMETISSYEEDSSAMGRMTAWGYAVEMAIDNPVLGVGAGSFNSAYGRIYRKAGDPVRWISTHSIYFNILAEYGFPGLFLLLSLIFINYRENRKTRRLISENAGNVSFSEMLPAFLNTSLVAFAVAGAFLTGVDYPHIYFLSMLTVSLRKLVEKEIEEKVEPSREEVFAQY